MRQRCVVVMLSLFICAAGTALAQTVWEDYPGNPVLGPGDPGSWDEFARGDPTVLFDGSIYHMWFGGYDATLSGGGLGHATSPDGVAWAVELDPVLPPGGPGQWDEFIWNHPAVILNGGLFHMWYGGQNALGIARGGYATSPDGSVWTKYEPGNPVIDVGPPGSWDERHVRPDAVVLEGGTYKMWYAGWSYQHSVAIGYAESTDGINWTKWPEPVLDGASAPAWDVLVANPSVVFDGFHYHIWYAGANGSPSDFWKVGYAFSSDGITWVRYWDNPVISVDGMHVYFLPVVFDGSTWHGWYSPATATNTPGIFYATSTCCGDLFIDGFESGDCTGWSLEVP